MTTPAYLVAVGAFLPGPPIGNDTIETHLGLIDGKPSRYRQRVLERNGIRTRHYAMDAQGQRLFANYEMAARAVVEALAKAGLERRAVEHLAAATTLSDVLVPGFASLVQGEVRLPPCDIASFHGVCASGIAALKSAFVHVRAGEAHTAVACASEFASRHFRASVLEQAGLRDRHGKLPFDAEFLRWMLSDGAGAAVIRDRPAAHGLSLRIEWIDVRSHADTRETCMYAGAAKTAGGGLTRLWADAASYEVAACEGMFVLRQDLSLLPGIVPLGVAHYLRLVQQQRLAGPPDWFICHYSSSHFRDDIIAELARAGAEIPAERWFSTLTERGNLGSASPYLLLHDLLARERLERGQKILLMVPESGRFITTFTLLTVVGPEDSAETRPAPPKSAPRPAKAEPERTALRAELVRRLAITWVDFAEALRRVPVIERLLAGRATLADYHAILLDLRQQVMEGSRWIARAASSFSVEHFALRSRFTRHAAAEHRDFLLLEADYAATGGDPELMRTRRKNPGSEALSAWMFQCANQENPFVLAGAMAIIEGLGNQLAREWGELFRHQLRLKPDQLTFLLYHGENDHTHLAELDEALDLLPLTPRLVEDIVHTAVVTARLYRLQLEELGNHA